MQTTTAVSQSTMRTILVIDDDLPMLLGLRALLERSGYNVISSENSVAGIKLAKAALPDLIVCDIMMPMMDGYKVRQEISQHPLTSNIPFLFLSARASQTDKLRGFDGDVDDYVTKPFDPRELVARIAAVFRRQEKDKLEAMHEVNHQIERIQNEISHNISHELRTPLTQILMSLELILREKYDNPEELKWFVEIALSQSQRLNGLIDDLIFLSGIDMGRTPCLRQVVDITYDFLTPISTRQELYKEKNIQVNINIDNEALIHAPRHEFRQAISHLVDNSLKFSPPMTSILVDLAANGLGGCIFTVTDYGPGIPAESRDKVFERYFQISQGDTRLYGGLGVGLTIAQTIAQCLGGDVVILPSESGCRVQMSIPPAPADFP